MLIVGIGHRTIDVDADFVDYVDENTFQCREQLLLRDLDRHGDISRGVSNRGGLY